MPKKQHKSPFYFFMLHFREEERQLGRQYNTLREVQFAASKAWQEMSAQQKGPFEKQAKDAKVGPSKEVEKSTSQGIPQSIIDREKKQSEQEEHTMKSTIKSTVVEAFTDNTIASQEFYFISGNYFVKSDDNRNYLPAEIAMVKFSFETGIINKFHIYVNPEKVPMSYQWDAKNDSEKTHRLPIPPNCKGERNYQRILNEMKAFMGEPMPILFTSKENIAMIKSFIQSFIDFGNSDDIERYRVYPIHQLFFEIKETAVQNCARETKSFKSTHVAEQYLRRDDYTYLPGTSCAYHEELDCAKYCALAHVQNWAYIFMDHICVDLNIDLIPGKQFPAEIDISHLTDATQSDFSVSTMNDTKQTYSNDTKNRTFIEAGQSSRYPVSASDAAVSFWSGRPKTPQSVRKNEDFPTLGSRNRKTGAALKRSNQHDPWNSSSSSSGSNPWHQLSAELNSSHARGMGRGSALFRSESGFGRSRSHK